jgi:hypothetical protein
MKDNVVRPGKWPNATHAASSRSSPGECEMAVTAIDYGGRLVTVVSQRVDDPSSMGVLQRSAFTTNIRGGSLSDSIWEATSWLASLRNHASAVSHVVSALETSIALDRKSD